MLSRREALIRIGSAAGVAALTPRRAGAQGAAKPEPPSVVSNPPRDFASPVTYPDPDIITHDPSFNAIRLGNTPIRLCAHVVKPSVDGVHVLDVCQRLKNFFFRQAPGITSQVLSCSITAVAFD